MKTIKNRKKRISLRALTDNGDYNIIVAEVNNKNRGLWLDGVKILNENDFQVIDKYDLAQKVKRSLKRLNCIYARMIYDSGEGW